MRTSVRAIIQWEKCWCSAWCRIDSAGTVRSTSSSSRGFPARASSRPSRIRKMNSPNPMVSRRKRCRSSTIRLEFLSTKKACSASARPRFFSGSADWMQTGSSGISRRSRRSSSKPASSSIRPAFMKRTSDITPRMYGW